jgi:hypothetical protein
LPRPQGGKGAWTLQNLKWCSPHPTPQPFALSTV